MRKRQPVCPDSNIFCQGLFVPATPAGAPLILAEQGLFQLVLLKPVYEEVARALEDQDREQARFERLATRRPPRVVPYPAQPDIEAHAHLLRYLRHRNDLAVLVAALQAALDWFISDNPDHFGPDLARATGLNIVTSTAFLRRLILPELEF